MSRIRLDRIVFSTFHEAFQNYKTSSGEIVVATTSLANGASRTTSVVIPYTRGGTVADIYATRGSARTLITSGGRAAASAIVQRTSSEIVRFDVTYSASSITIELVMTNSTGGAINPTAQTIVISVVQYDAPVTSI